MQELTPFFKCNQTIHSKKIHNQQHDMKFQMLIDHKNVVGFNERMNGMATWQVCIIVLLQVLQNHGK